MEEFSTFLQGKSQLKLCIIDNNNLQFCEQNNTRLIAENIFSYHDAVLIPEWVAHEIAHSDARTAYIEAISIPLFILKETDYLSLIDYHDISLMHLFYYASMPGRKPFKYLKKKLSLIEKEQEEISDDWISVYYQEAFEMNNDAKMNAGENSILALAILLVHYLKNRLHQVTICSNDTEVRDIKINILDYVMQSQYFDNPKRNNMTFLSTDLILQNELKKGRIQLADIQNFRTNQRRIFGFIRKGDNTTEEIDRVVDTTEFLALLVEDLTIHF